jgi:hypothetical protein
MPDDRFAWEHRADVPADAGGLRDARDAIPEGKVAAVAATHAEAVKA